MSWATRYHKPIQKYWRGRTDAPKHAYVFQIVQLLDLRQVIPFAHQLTFALLGFRCDEGIRRNLGRIGAIDGPIAIREVLAKLPAPHPHITCYDAGDIVCHDGDLETAQKNLSECITMLLQKQIIPIVLGGGHELAWGHYRGIMQTYAQEKMGIINVDAHFDMRSLLDNERGSSGTPFLQIAEAHKKAKRPFDYNCIGIQHNSNIQSLFTTAHEFAVHVLTAGEIQLDGDKPMHFINRVLRDNDKIYLSICLDAFAEPFAPGVSAPQPLGLFPWHVIPMVRQVAASGKAVSYDVAELSPVFDIDKRTARLAANLIYEIMQHHKTEEKFNTGNIT